MTDRPMSPIHSIFDIAGRNENALTKSFGVVLRRDKTLLSHFLSKVTGRRVTLTNAEFTSTTFRFEKSHEEGRVDIEIVISGRWHIFVESKTGKAEVGENQAERYARVLEKSQCRERIFVFLTQIDNLEISESLKVRYPSIRFFSLGWQSSLELIMGRRSITVDLVEEYRMYLLEARRMKIHDIDIWAVAVRNKQIENFDSHGIYLHSERHSPVFIGKREWDKKLRRVVVRVLRPVLNVHDRDSLQGRRHGGVFVYELGAPLVIADPIVNQFSQRSAISIPFERLQLLSR